MHRLAQRRRQWFLIAACAAVAVICSAALFARGYPVDFGVFRVTAYSVSFLVAGSVASLRRPDSRLGPVMLATSVCGSLSFFGGPSDPLMGRIAGAFGSMTNLLGVWFVLAAPTGRIPARSSRALLGAFVVILLIGNLVTDLTILRVGFAAGAVVAALIGVAVVRRWLGAQGASRRALTPVAIAGVAMSSVFALDFGAGVLLVPIVRGSPIFWASLISRTLVPFGYLAGLLRLRMARAAVADLVVDLGETAPPERMREALAGALGDPTIEVIFWSPAAGRYVATDGAAVDPEALKGDRSVTYLRNGSEPLAAILHDPALTEDPGLVAAAAAAVRLAVDNERLAAEVEAQLEEVRASRARIVAAGDAERRRVERNLHDGAQQRLVSMTLALRLAQARLGDDADPAVRRSLEQASSDARAALSELRELARGLHPEILTQAGLGPALESLAERSPVAVDVEVEGPRRYPAAIESAAYFVVSEGLVNIAKYASATRATVRVVDRDASLTIEISDDGVGGADPARGSGLRGLADRLSALDGTLDVASPPGGGTRLVARVPIPSAIPA